MRCRLLASEPVDRRGTPRHPWIALVLISTIGACGVSETDHGDLSAVDGGPEGLLLDVEPGAIDPSSSDRPGTDPDEDPGPEAPEEDDASDPDLPALPLPNDPPLRVQGVPDDPFVQEFNHTLNEVDPALVPLVAVTLRPTGFPGEGPVQVLPRGLAWQRREDGTWDLRGPAPEDPDCLHAAAGIDFVALASTTLLYRVASDGTVTRVEAPTGLPILGLDRIENEVWVRTGVGASVLPPEGAIAWPTAGEPVTAIAALGVGVVALGHPDGSVSLHDRMPDGSLGPETLRFAVGSGAVRALVAPVLLPEPMDLVAVTDEGISGFRVDRHRLTVEPVEPPLFASNRVPLRRPVAAARTWDGGFVVATGEGAMRVLDRGWGPEWRVYGAERWLPTEDVRGVATDPDRELAPLYLATSGGLASVTARRMTLKEKFAPFVDRVVQRHDRDGAVADSRLLRKGDLSTNVPWDSDNDGWWTSYWLVGECLRWRESGDPAAKAHFDRSLEAMLRLRTLTGTDWFLARSVIRKEGCRLDDCDDPDDGHWYTSPDGQWWVKRDTSNDELAAHFWMMAVAFEFCADEDQRKRIADHLRGIVGGLIDHGFVLLDPVTMQPTTYGRLDPEYVNEWIAGVYGDGGLRAAILLSGLQVAWWTTGEDRFLEAKWSLVEEHGYADAAEREMLHEVRPLSMDNDEMSATTWWTLLRYESDPWLRSRWEIGSSRLWEVKLRVQQAALWSLLRATSGYSDPDMARDVRDWLRRVPVDMIRWNQRNSHRRDVVPVDRPFDPRNGGLRSDGRPIPYDERPCDRFNTDQYRLDGGMDGRIEMDGAEALMCHSMARFFGLLHDARGP